MGFNWKTLANRSGKKTPPVVEKQDKQPSKSPPEPAQPSEFDEIRARVDASLSQMSSLLRAIKAPLPLETGDGSALAEVQKTGVRHIIATIIADMSKLGIDSELKVAKMGLKLRLGEDIDDREYLMEYLVRVGSMLFFWRSGRC